MYQINHEGKVGHHGSSSSTTDAFLDKTSPEYAVISVGEDNQYGHPTQETLERLQKKNVELYRTDMQGMITCVSDGERVFFQTERNSSADTYTDAGGYKNAAIESNKAVEEEAAAAAQQSIMPEIRAAYTPISRESELIMIIKSMIDKGIEVEQFSPEEIIEMGTGPMHLLSIRTEDIINNDEVRSAFAY